MKLKLIGKITGATVVSTVGIGGSALLADDRLDITNYTNRNLDALGIPNSCNLLFFEKTDECSLNVDSLKNINFSSKGDGSLTVTGTPTTKLKIEKVQDKDFPKGIRLTFTPNTDTKIGENDSESMDWKANTGYEFKITVNRSAKKVLERVWKLPELAEKAGLVCENDNSCKIKDNSSINVFVSENDYRTGSSIDSSKKIKVQKDKKYKWGYKFTIEEDIQLTNGTNKKTTEGVSKLFKNKSYEIKLREIVVNQTKQKKWFLCEKIEIN